MSVRKDCEMLSIETMKAYAKKYSISGDEAARLFDDNTMETVQLYIANILTVQEAVERLRYNNVNNQVSFHTLKALQYLTLVRRNSYARNDI